MIEEILLKLDSLKNNHQLEFSKSLIPSSLPMLGVKVPDLRIIAKDISKTNPILFLNSNPLNIYELEMLQAMVIGYMKEDLNIVLDYAKSFIPLIHDWSVNDCFCQTFKIAKKHQKEVWELLKFYFDSRNEFELRCVVVMMLSHFINDDYVDEVIKFIDKTKNDGYYYKIACAWCLQVIMVKYPDKCLAYLKNNNLDNWTHNKAISKMIESYRISLDMKDKLKKIKRK